MEIINSWQTIFTGLAFIAASVAAYFSYSIGTKQNEINERSLNISNFVEIFLMPQQVILQDPDDKSKTTIIWNVLIKNVSSYPIYLNDFTLNGIKQDIGSSAIPNDFNSWYAIPIPNDVQTKGEFSLTVFFEDYLRKRYQAEGFGKFNGVSWSIRSKKRIEL